MDRPEDLHCKCDACDYLPSKSSFWELLCKNIHLMIFAKVVSFHISGICCFSSGGEMQKAALLRDGLPAFLQLWARLARDVVEVG